MSDLQDLKNEFIKLGGVLKTKELNRLGFSSRQIRKLLDSGFISKIKSGFYELTDYIPKEEAIIGRLFPNAVIFLESALFYYEYTDRIPKAVQIAVSRDSKTSQFSVHYPLIKPFYLEPKFLAVGVESIKVDDISVQIYDRDRTICDVLRFESKLEEEVFATAIKRYMKDPNKNVRNLFEYAEVFNIKNKVQTYIGMWLS